MRLEIYRFLRISQGPSFWRSLLAFDAWFWRYLSCLSALGSHRAAFRSRFWPLFVVAGHTFGGHCFSWMLDFDAICRGRRYFCKSLLVFDAWFCRYMWCSRALGHFIVCIRCLILTLYVVFQSTWPFYCLLSKSTLNAICRGRTSSVSSCFPSEVDFERYLSCLELLLDVQSVIFNIFLMILRLRPKILSGSLIQTSQKGLRLQIQQILTIWLDFNKDFIWKNEAWNFQFF